MTLSITTCPLPNHPDNEDVAAFVHQFIHRVVSHGIPITDPEAKWIVQALIDETMSFIDCLVETVNWSKDKEQWLKERVMKRCQSMFPLCQW